MRDAIRVMKQLILNGEINDRDDPELFSLAMTDEIRNETDIYEDEWGCRVVRTMHNIYLVPASDNEMFNMRLRDIKKIISPAAKNLDAYLQCYIIMVILWMFFRSRNGDPQSTDSLRIKDIVKEVDDRFSSDRALAVMEEAQINFHRIADKWNGSVLLDEGRKTSKTELVKIACRILIRNELAVFADDEDEIRTKRRLSDLMKYYYLSDKRITEINEIFEKVNNDAGDQ